MGMPDRDTRPYGGVANDVRWIGEQWKSASEQRFAYVPIQVAMSCYFGLIDFPLSLVADTVTLPEAIRRTYFETPASPLSGRRYLGGAGSVPETSPSQDAPPVR